MIKLKNVTLEGPDLSGKTTLMSQIHKKTNNKYNIIQSRKKIDKYKIPTMG